MSLSRKTNRLFRVFAENTAAAMGSPITFAVATLATLIWLGVGPLFQFNEAWNFAANSSTTVITFLMIFVLQNSQNREARIAKLERNVILKAISDAPNSMIGLQGDSDERLDEIEADLAEARRAADEGEDS